MLRHLAAGYAEAGHEVVMVVPGRHDATTATPFAAGTEARRAARRRAEDLAWSTTVSEMLVVHGLATVSPRTLLPEATKP